MNNTKTATNAAAAKQAAIWHVERHNGRFEIWPKDKGQTHTYIGVAQTAENATLMAASPELLETLRTLYKLIDDNSGQPSVVKLFAAMEKARAAIAKATEGSAL